MTPPTLDSDLEELPPLDGDSEGFSDEAQDDEPEAEADENWLDDTTAEDEPVDTDDMLLIEADHALEDERHEEAASDDEFFDDEEEGAVGEEEEETPIEGESSFEHQDDEGGSDAGEEGPLDEAPLIPLGEELPEEPLHEDEISETASPGYAGAPCGLCCRPSS